MSPSRGRRFGPAFIAVMVVLAGSAGTIGYLVTRQMVDTQAVVGGPGPGGGTNPAGQSPGGGGSPGATRGSTSGTKACLDVTEKAAVAAGSVGGLKQVLYVRTSRSEVWICKDTAGVLWYQGHSPRSEPITAATSGSTLFLSKVELEGEGFVAYHTSGDQLTTYHVSTKELRVENPDVTEQVIYFE